MIRIKSNINLANGYYVASLSIHSMESAEKDRIAALGPFEFEVGGDYTAGLVAFTLPTRIIALTELPVQQSFPVDVESDDAQERANLWISENLIRISDAEGAWKALELPEGLGETIHNIPTT